MSKVSATEIFNVSLDRAYAFCLFFFTLDKNNPNPKFLGKGSISETEMLNQLQSGQPVVFTDWEYPNYFILARMMEPVIAQTKMSFHPTDSGVKATWTFSLKPTSFASRIFTAIPRWRMARTKGEDNEVHKDLLKLKSLIEIGESGLEEAFLYFKAGLKQEDLSIEDIVKKEIREQMQGIPRCAAFCNVLALFQPEHIDKSPALKTRDLFTNFAGLYMKATQEKDVTSEEITAEIDDALEELQKRDEAGEDLLLIFPHCVAWSERIGNFENAYADIKAHYGVDKLSELKPFVLRKLLLTLKAPTDADIKRAIQLSENVEPETRQAFEMGTRQAFQLWAKRGYPKSQKARKNLGD